MSENHSNLGRLFTWKSLPSKVLAYILQQLTIFFPLLIFLHHFEYALFWLDLQSLKNKLHLEKSSHQLHSGPAYIAIHWILICYLLLFSLSYSILISDDSTKIFSDTLEWIIQHYLLAPFHVSSPLECEYCLLSSGVVVLRNLGGH
jgi:hypothetical protein